VNYATDALADIAARVTAGESQRVSKGGLRSTRTLARATEDVKANEKGRSAAWTETAFPLS